MGNYKIGKVERKCLFCQKVFYVFPYRVRLNQAKFCSRVCVNNYITQYIGDKKYRKFQSILKTKYKISIDDFEKLKIIQKNKCAICNRVRKLVIDHNHDNNRVRGLLCTQCNTGLGLFDDNKILLNDAITYLNKQI